MFQVDKVFYDGNIYTMENEGKTVSAMVVYDGKIIDTGTDEEMLKYNYKEKIDLKGKTVLPGFIDTHCHIAEAVEGQLKVDLSGCASFDEVVERMKKALPYVEPGKYLFGYQISEWGLNGLPDIHVLDKISTDIPVFISDNGLHSFIGNTKLLEVLEIGKGFSEPGYQGMEVDGDGVPTGIFREHAMLKYLNKGRPSVFKSKEHMLEMLKKKLMDWSSYGYTTLHSCDGFSESEIDKMSVYQELLRKGELKMRVILNKQYAVDNEVGAISGAGNDMIKYGALKIFTDGSFSGRSALVIDDYINTPGNKGKTAHSFEEFRDIIKHAYDIGDDIAIHVIGDGGMEWVIKVMDEIYDPSRKQQFELIHVSLTNESQWKRLKKYPVVIATQPIFLPDMLNSKNNRLGTERGNHLMAYKSWIDNGLIVGAGEDGPIYSSNPFLSMYYAITRYIGNGEYLNKNEAVSTYQAVCMYTKYASYCAHEENIKGTLSNGKVADFVVLPKDIFKISPEELKDLYVESTYLAGERVYG